jgi:hypothetical protein
VRIPKGEKQKGTKAIFEAVMHEKFSNLVPHTKRQIQTFQRTLSRINAKQTRHLICTTSSDKPKWKNLLPVDLPCNRCWNKSFRETENNLSQKLRYTRKRIRWRVSEDGMIVYLSNPKELFKKKNLSLH